MNLAYGAIPDYAMLERHDFRVCKCNSCDLFFQTAILNEVGLKRLYDDWISPTLALQWHQTAIREFPFELLRRLTFVSTLLSTSGMEILDWGAGFGQFCDVARALGHNAFAVELSNWRKSYLRRLGVPVLTTAAMRERTFHFVNVDQVLEHETHPRDLLIRIRGLLRDDGLLFVATPNCTGLEKRLSAADGLSPEKFKLAMLEISALQHINGFTRRSLERLCRECGFEPIFRPLTYIGSSNFGVNIGEVLRAIARPFYHRMSTVLFLRKARPSGRLV